MIVRFPTTLDIRYQHDGGRITWEVLSPFIVIVNPNQGDQRIIRIPSGQRTDFASVPRIPLAYMAYANRAHLPAIVHDYLYAQGGTQADKDYADSVFLQGMLDTDEDPGDAHIMYLGVRKFGAAHFNFYGGAT